MKNEIIKNEEILKKKKIVESANSFDESAPGNAVDCTVHIGNGNIFADTGRDNAGELQAKAILSIRIEQLIQERKLTQSQAAILMDVSQPDVSLMVRGRLRGFTIDRLLQCIQSLGQDVTIVLPPVVKEDNRRGKIVVSYEDNIVPTQPHRAAKQGKRIKKRSSKLEQARV